MDLDIFNNPPLLAVVIVLSGISFVLFSAGLKTRNPVWALYGVAFGVPTFAPTSAEFWVLGGLIGLFAHWVSRQV